MPPIKRAFVLIGVRQTPTLPVLPAVWDGVRRMKQWAVSQGVDEALIDTITDEHDTPVTPARIKQAVRNHVERGDLDQLVLYFAGHGVNLNYGEYWLLSEAIVDADAAVNVRGSEERARYGVVPHVVFISDACRTAPQGIQAQGIEGSVIFPNQPVPGPEKAVDLFYATLLGTAALEISDPADAAGRFQAVYTDALLEALHGMHHKLLERQERSGPALVRPWPLKKFLAEHLPGRVYEMTRDSGNPRSQQPDARITSDHQAWLSRLDLPEPVAGSPPRFGGSGEQQAAEHAVFAQAERERPAAILREALISERSGLGEILDRVGITASGSGSESGIKSPDQTEALNLFYWQNRQFVGQALRTAESFGPLHFETGCGFKVRGGSVRDCLSHHARCEILTGGELVQCSPNGPAASVLLQFENGWTALLPALDGFLATVTLDRDSLVDVAYEPSDLSPRWREYQDRARELRNLRAVIAASSRLGTFRLDGAEAGQLVRRMQVAQGVDPSLALYAAHALRDQGRRQRIVPLLEAIRGDTGVCLFDIALLAHRLNPDPRQRDDIVPFLPLLAQSWALLPAREIRLPGGLEKISRHVSPESLWTLFDGEGARIITEVIQEGSFR